MADKNQPKKVDEVPFDLSDANILKRIAAGAIKMSDDLQSKGCDVNYVYCERARLLAQVAQSILDLYNERGHTGVTPVAPEGN